MAFFSNAGASPQRGRKLKMAGGREFFVVQQCLPVLKPEKQIRNMAIIYGECLNALEIKV